LKSLRIVRIVVLLSLFSALFSLALVAGFLNAASLTSHGSTGQALALRAALRGLAAPSAHSSTFAEIGMPTNLRRGPDGRYIYSKASLMRAGLRLKPRAGAAVSGQVDEAVQTFDVFNPPPTFTPTQGPNLTPTNLTPVWTADETMLIFSSNRTVSGGIGTRFHLWAIPINGGTPVQLTDSAGTAGGGEFFPALSAGNNQQIAFTSDANSPGTQNLYSMAFTAQTVNVVGMASPTLRTTDPQAIAQGGTGFSNVQRPTFSAANSDQIVFSAFSTAGVYAGHSHLYFLYVTTGGYSENSVSLPAKLTDGPADDTDPAYSQDGQLIAFASTAASTAQTASANLGPSSDPSKSLITTASSGALRNIFLIGGGGRIGFGNVANGGTPATLPGTDNFGPAWSSPRSNPYLNPAPGTDYISFARGASQSAPHDIYYLPVLSNINAGGETGYSNEQGTTPYPAAIPVYQINSGGGKVTDPNFPSQVYEPGNYFEIDGFGNSITPVDIIGGAVEALSPTPVVNLLNDPSTPPAVYNDEHTGTFTYLFKYLTPGAKYQVRLHMSDPKDSKPGQRVFNVSINGKIQSVPFPDPTTGTIGTTSIDIVQQAQASPGTLDGLVSDATSSTAIAGATITVTDYTTGANVTTNPTPLTTTSTTTADPNPKGAGNPINYLGSLPRGTYIVTVTPPAGSGYVSESQTVIINSGFFNRADFKLTQGSGTLNGIVTDSTGTTPLGGVNITVTDVATGITIGANPATVNAADGTYSLTLPPGNYYVTATPQAASGYAVQTGNVPITNGTAVTENFALGFGAAVGTVGGLVTDSVTTQPLAGATVKFLNNAGKVIAITQTTAATAATAATASPAPPNGDSKPLNYSLLVPTGAGSLSFSAPGYVTQPKAITIVNTPANTTTGAAANAFIRADAALVNSTPNTGQNTAVVDQFSATALRSPLRDQNGLIIAPADTISVAFTPVSGDPPIVQAIELISDSNAATSSAFGGFGGTPATAAPTIDSVLGGTVGATSQVVVSFELSPGNGKPSGFNIYRTVGTLITENSPPITTNSGTEGNIPYITNATVVDTGKFSFATGQEIFSFTDTTTALNNEYFYQISAVYNQSVTPETAAGGTNLAVKLNTDDNPGETSASGNVYDDQYPTWSPFINVFSMAYQSGNYNYATGAVTNGRSVTYNSPQTGNAPSETAISVGDGQPLGGSSSVGASYTGILESQVLNLDPPTLLPYSGSEIVHVADAAGNTTRGGNQPGQPVTFVVRLSSREAGIDDAGGPKSGPNVYIQIKNPNSKYQDANGLEHKVFAKDATYRFQANNPNSPNLLDSGSSTILMNGGQSPNAPFPYSLDGYFGYNRFASNANIAGLIGPTFNGTAFVPQRGAVGGIDGPESGTGGAGVNAPVGAASNNSDTISVGIDGGGSNSQTPVDAKGVPVVDANKRRVVLPGGNPGLFIPWGPEYECQVVNPQFGINGLSDTTARDYRDPYYLAGVDDQQPFSGLGKERPTTDTPSGNNSFIPAEWLQLNRLPAAQQDNQGGVLYSASWRTPTSGSDYYLDVIAFDKAVAPSTSTLAGTSGSNWRIYDNVWGFSTAPSLSSNDILVVSDYALGQKFAASTFGGQNGLLNLIPKLYGAESYVTDIDTSRLPNAIYRTILYPSADANNPANYTSEALDLGTGYDTNNNAYQTISGQPIPALNGLGVGSYDDKFIEDGGRVDGAPAVRSQQYSLWRILSRGPIPAAVYQAYEPTITTQPAVTDPGAPKGFTSILAGKVPAANRCILWISPFTGDVLAGPGTLLDPATQVQITNFVAAGGRLCVSGQNVASALTQSGTVNNGAAGFLSTVLNATFLSAKGGTHLPVATGISPIDNRISFTPFYDGVGFGNYPELNPGDTLSNAYPGERPLRISNNFGGNIFNSVSGFGPVAPVTAAYSGNWRTDGSLDQLGPYPQPFPAFSNNSVVSQINTITPNKSAHLDLTLAPFVNPIGPAPSGNDAAASAPGGAGLIYTENPITTGTVVGGATGNGSKVVFASFGLEGLSTEYYKQTVTSIALNPIVYLPRNQRQNLLHNIVSYLRTGSITGTVRATTGNGAVGSGVSGVTLYVLPAFATAIPGRGTFSATTDSAGNYHIDGIESGSYTLAAYKTGFNRATSNTATVFTIEGDVTVSGANLTISQATGGVISGIVTDGVKPVAGVAVTFTSSDGTTSQNATTDSNGSYTLPNVPPATYTGIVTDPPAFGQSATSAPVTVTGNSNSTVNFTLKVGPGTATGRVLDLTTNLPIAGATVSFTTGASTTPITATTAADGTYTTTLTAGTYTVVASAAKHGNSQLVTIVVTGGQPTTVADILLGPVVSSTLGGLVTATSSSSPLGGATVTVTSSGTVQSVTTVTSSTATNGPDGAPLNYTVTVAQGTYSVTVSKSGVTTASQTVTISGTGFQRVDFTGSAGLPPVHTFSAGLNFLSLPYDYSGFTFDSLFGTLNTALTGSPSNGNRSHVAVWAPAQGVYELDPNAPADALRLGVGYWIYLKTAVAIGQTGGASPASVAVPLTPSWNQIGVPGITGVLVSSLTFDMGNNQAPLSFADATSSQNHVVSPTLYRYDGTAYQPVAATDTLQPWQAYWIKAFVSTTVRIPSGK